MSPPAVAGWQIAPAATGGFVQARPRFFNTCTVAGALLSV
jgi:hypothetical protein